MRRTNSFTLGRVSGTGGAQYAIKIFAAQGLAADLRGSCKSIYTDLRNCLLLATREPFTKKYDRSGNVAVAGVAVCGDGSKN